MTDGKWIQQIWKESCKKQWVFILKSVMGLFILGNVGDNMEEKQSQQLFHWSQSLHKPIYKLKLQKSKSNEDEPSLQKYEMARF